MSFRTVEITGPAEIHVTNGTLVIEKISAKKEYESKARKISKKAKKQDSNNKYKIVIPLEDIGTIVCMGAGIRISTMAMAKLCQYKISITMLDEKYRPSGILTAYDANARQSLIMRRQVYMDENALEKLWRNIVRRKIENQAEALKILGLKEAKRLESIAEQVLDVPEIDALEAQAAKLYFSQLSPDMNRRQETAMNSRLNYGYAIIRNSIIRAIVANGLLPSFGIHHQNLYNAFNLADDLIEPFRPCVDIIAYSIDGGEITLSREERKQLATVVQQAVMIKGKKLPVLHAIDIVVADYKKYIMHEGETIHMPKILKAETIKLIGE